MFSDVQAGLLTKNEQPNLWILEKLSKIFQTLESHCYLHNFASKLILTLTI